MDKERKTRKLNVEELEKRVAPLAFTVSDPTQNPTQDPTVGTSKDRVGDPLTIANRPGGRLGPGKQYTP